MSSQMKAIALLVTLAILQVYRCAASDLATVGLDEERLRRVIAETITPKPAARRRPVAEVQSLLAWSKPVNGLVARIDAVTWRFILVRLKNVSDHPLTVPAGNSAAETLTSFYDVFLQQGSSGWQRITAASQYERYFGKPNAYKVGSEPNNDRPWVVLQPGDDCIALVPFERREGTGEPETIKVIFRQEDATKGRRWIGVLETPSRPMLLTQEQQNALPAAVPFPAHFPQLSYDYSGFISGGEGSETELLYGPNRWLVDTLAIYEPSGVAKEFERRMEAEEVAPMKLLLASIAAAAGSEKAALSFLTAMRKTDSRTIANLHYALWLTSESYSRGLPNGAERKLPDWLIEICLSILSDKRLVSRYPGPDPPTIASSAYYVLFALEGWKVRKAVPLLIKRVKEGKVDWHTVSALGKIGDDRAIPTVIQLFKAIAENGQLAGEEQRRADLTSYADVLADLKARDAVPVLLRYTEYPEIVRVLAEIGDERALPAMRNIVAARGRVLRDGKPVSPTLEPERLFAAKMGLARLEPKNEAQHLVEMVADSNHDQRYQIVLRLGQLSDPRAIPILVKLIKTESGCYIIDLAIQGLAGRKEKAAIEGLIDCLDVVFRDEDLGKGEHVTPATYRNHIARSLQQITGQSFGADKARWLKWWETARQSARFR